MRIWDARPFTSTFTRCPTCRPSVRRVRGPRAISRGPAGARPASRVRNPLPAQLVEADRGHHRAAALPGAATLTCP